MKYSVSRFVFSSFIAGIVDSIRKVAAHPTTSITRTEHYRVVSISKRQSVKLAFHDADTDTGTDILADILERIVARMSVSRATYLFSFPRAKSAGSLLWCTQLNSMRYTDAGVKHLKVRRCTALCYTAVSNNYTEFFRTFNKKLSRC